MSVITLVALGTWSYIQAQAPNSTQDQNQAANQKSSGGLISRLFKGDDPPNQTNNATATTAVQTSQAQPVPRQTGTPITPPPPTTRGGYPSTSPGTTTAMGTRPVQPQQTQVAQAPPATANNRTPLSQTVSGVGSGISESQMQRMAELYERMPDIKSPSTGGNSTRAISIGGSGPPSPPPIVGAEIEQPQRNTPRSISTSPEENTTEDRRTVRHSISTTPKVDSLVETSPEQQVQKISPDNSSPTKTPDVSPKAVENNRDKPIPEPTPKDTTQPTTQVPEPIPSLSNPPRQPQPIISNERLAIRQNPLDIDLKGPTAMLVGKEETYMFVATNNTPVTVGDVVLNITLPRWTQNTQTPELSAGSTKQLSLPGNEEYCIFQWHVGQIVPGKPETLKLYLKTLEKRPFEIKYDYEVRQTAPITKIDVQQPVINMEFHGPDEVLWGSEENYRLKIRNIGNGDANDLMLKFSASGVIMGETTIDSLPVGEERILDVTVQTREPDMKELQINIQVAGPYGLSEETTKLVVIKRAALDLQIDAPGMQYVGNTLDYVLIARNSGTTASSGTVVEATLPLGVKYVSCTHNGEFDSETNRVRWNAGTLPIGGQFDCMLVCEAKRDGECRLDAKVTEKTGLEATDNAVTCVESIADVLLEIEKPQDPIKVGMTTEYLITITNRGSKAAENVEVAVYFAPGAIEPLDVDTENARINVARGEVVFESIPVLSATETLKFRVKARGLISGSHRVRTMLVCQSTETQLTQEITSRFYEDRNSMSFSGQPNRSNASSTLAWRGNTSQNNDFTGMTNTPVTTPGTPIVPTRPITSPQGTPVMPSNSNTVNNPLANSGPVTSRMQQSADDEENTIPVMSIPNLDFGRQSTTVPTFGTPSTRPRTTGSVPILSPPPIPGN